MNDDVGLNGYELLSGMEMEKGVAGVKSSH